MTRQRIQKLLRDNCLLWYPLYRDQRGIVHIKPADIAILKPILRNKGMLDSYGRITGECSPSELAAILKENNIAEKVSNNGLGEIELSRFKRLDNMVIVLQTPVTRSKSGKQ